MFADPRSSSHAPRFIQHQALQHLLPLSRFFFAHLKMIFHCTHRGGGERELRAEIFGKFAKNFGTCNFNNQQNIDAVYT